MFKVISVVFATTLYLVASNLSITGTVVSDNQKMIGARYMGYVKKIYFNIGDKVHREDTLFEMESAEFDILKSQADLALEQAEIMVDMYRTRMESIRREKALLRVRGKDNTLDWNNLDISAENIQAGLAASRSLLENAATKVKQMATIANYLEMKAPNDGIIVQKQIRVGDLIVPGMLAMVLVDLDHLEIEAQISESDLYKVREGDFVNVRIPSIKYRTRGRIKSVVPSANPMTHTFTIRVKFKKEGKRIFPGMYAKIDVEYSDNVVSAFSSDSY
ncbi:Probable RND efflux membrane fusion protein [hydrothermal vent metagenome]|uniref:Probable RND efflux membrane fusion protein n=1 Tax=hydrothermal vent metagenome TaxID=652676 RepID=A0A1W1BFM7_9ZZZZ